MESDQLRQDASHIHLFAGLCGGRVRLRGDQGPNGVMVRVSVGRRGRESSHSRWRPRPSPSTRTTSR